MKNYLFTKEQIELGIKLCNANIKRLCKGAKKLLEAEDTLGLSYCLLTLAIEELGKLAILKEAPLTKIGFDVSQDVFRNHEMKFKKGLRVSNTVDKLEWLPKVRVNSNAASNTITIPFGERNIISIAPAITGTFEDTSNEPTTKIRLEMLYVDWNETLKEWSMPEHVVGVPKNVQARFEFSKNSLQKKIEEICNASEKLASENSTTN